MAVAAVAGTGAEIGTEAAVVTTAVTTGSGRGWRMGRGRRRKGPTRERSEGTLGGAIAGIESGRTTEIRRTSEAGPMIEIGIGP